MTHKSAFSDTTWPAWGTLLVATLVVWVPGMNVARAQSNSAPRKVVQRGIQAMGGPAAIRRLQTPMMWMERGTFHGMGEPTEFVAQYAAHWPDWNREEVEQAFVITRRHGQVWVSGVGGSNARLLREDTRAERLGQIHQSWAMRLFPLLSEPYELTTIPGERDGAKRTHGVLAKHPRHREMRFYFDSDSGLPVKVITQVVSAQTGPEPVRSEARLSDHRNVGGVVVPGKVRWYYAGKLFVESHLVDYKFAATLDPAQFTPSVAAAVRPEN